MSRTKERSTLARPTLIGVMTALIAPLVACSTSGPTGTDGALAKEAGFEELVYAVRQTQSADGTPIVADGMGQVMDYGRYVPGGRLEVMNLATSEIRNILEGARYAK